MCACVHMCMCKWVCVYVGACMCVLCSDCVCVYTCIHMYVCPSVSILSISLCVLYAHICHKMWGEMIHCCITGFGGRQLSNSPMLDFEEQRMALTPDERQKQVCRAGARSFAVVRPKIWTNLTDVPWYTSLPFLWSLGIHIATYVVSKLLVLNNIFG